MCEYSVSFIDKLFTYGISFGGREDVTFLY